jgi:integral membrane protein
MNIKTSIGQFRIIALLEGLSFVILLFVCMPLKYIMGMPMAVKIGGMVHGLLFVAFIALLYQVKTTYNWSIKKTGIAFLASLIPFGTFMMDKNWKNEVEK